MTSRPTLQQGFALVLVLWVLSLLAIMAGSFALSMRRESAIIEGVKHSAETQGIAESGLAIAELMMLDPDAHSRWRTDGSIYQIDFPNASVRVRLISETGKIDVNTANQKLLTGLMTHAPVEQDQQLKVLGAIMDWRDADEEVREQGAEKAEYKRAKLSYGPRNKRFHSIEELQMVLGINHELYQWLEPRVTVYSGQEVDLKVATKEVLQVLPDIDASKIDSYVQVRLQNASKGLPAPVFPTLGQDANELEATAEEAAQVQDEAVASQEPGAVEQEVEVGVVEMLVEVQMPDEVNTLLQAVVEKSDTGTGAPFKVLKWQRNYDSDLSLFSEEMSEFLVGQYAEPQFDN